MNRAIWIACLLASGCLSPQYHDGRPERAGEIKSSFDKDSGTGSATLDGGDIGGRVYFEFYNDKHIIDTDRMLLLFAEPGVDCREIDLAVSATFAESPSFFTERLLARLGERALWHHDGDMCQVVELSDGGSTPFGDLVGVPVPKAVSETTSTVVAIGYNVGASEPSLSNCLLNARPNILFNMTAREGFDPNAPDRCNTVDSRCGGDCVIDTSIR